MAKKDYYQVLGVKKDAKADEIKKSYRRLARKFHPDVNPNDKASEDKFKEVQEAYDVLSDEKKRKVFDRFGYYNDNLDPDSPFASGAGAGAGAPGFDFSGFQWDTSSTGPSGGRAFVTFSRTSLGEVVLPGPGQLPSLRVRCPRRDAILRFRSL
jgi:molecular chaperone DnaJ